MSVFKKLKNWWIGREELNEEPVYKILLIEPFQLPSGEYILRIGDDDISEDALELESGEFVFGRIKGSKEVEKFIIKRVKRAKRNQWYLIHSESRIRSRIDDFNLIAQ